MPEESAADAREKDNPHVARHAASPELDEPEEGKEGDDGEGGDEDDGPEPPPPASPDLAEAEALLASLNKSGARVQTLWFTFLTITVYFAVATAGTTHRMLFLEEGLPLPLVNLKLPLLGFYFLAPLVYLVIHVYFFLMLALLAGTAAAFEKALAAALPRDDQAEAQQSFRMRIENALFAQILSGPRSDRVFGNDRMLSLIAGFTSVVAPVCVLLLFQLMFLPYHSVWLTWWHRGLVALDLIFAWTLWPSFWRGRNARVRGGSPVWYVAAKVAVTALVLVFSIAEATYPGEWIHQSMVAKVIDKIGDGIAHKIFRVDSANDRIISSSLFGREKILVVDYSDGMVVGRLWDWSRPVPIDAYHRYYLPDDGRRGLFPNRLWLPGEVLIDREKLKLAEEYVENLWVPSVSLVERDLSHARLDYTDLRRADFSRARVTGANLSGALLQGAHFQPRDGAGAFLDFAHLERADLTMADLRGASFEHAVLLDAKFTGAQLQAADLSDVRAEMAEFWGTDLVGASLDRAHLPLAIFYDADLQAAAISSADLQGADLTAAHLQGATLSRTDLRGVRMLHAGLWRSTGLDDPELPINSMSLQDLRCGRSIDGGEPGPLFDKWRKGIMVGLPEYLRSDVEKRLQVLDPAARLVGTMTPEFCEHLSRPFLQSEDRADPANVLERLVCQESAPTVVHSLVRSQRIEAARPDLHNVLKRWRAAKESGSADCPGAAALTAEDLEYLERRQPHRRPNR